MALRECAPLAFPLRTGHGRLPVDVAARPLAVRTRQRFDALRTTKGLLARLTNPGVLGVVCHRCERINLDDANSPKLSDRRKPVCCSDELDDVGLARNRLIHSCAELGA